VAPAYDGVGEQTALAGAQVVYEMLTNMVKRGLKDKGEETRVYESQKVPRAVRDEL
jgi:agmatinase